VADRRILLADADAFFVAVARAVDPEGAGKEPLLIVGGSRASRGVVCSASYEARQFGVRSAMPISQALRLCPRAMCVPVPGKACSTKSAEIRTVLQRYAPVVEGASVDEWYLDLSGTEGVYHHEPLADTAHRMRDAVHRETGISISIGGGTNKLIAKLAVERAKPKLGANGVHIVPPGTEEVFLRTFALAELPMVGPKFQERLAALRMTTVPDVLRHDLAALKRLLGDREAEWLWDRVRGVNDSPVEVGGEAKSISRDVTFMADLRDDKDLDHELLRLVTRAAFDLRGDGLAARTITVRIRDMDFRTRSAQRTLMEPVVSDRVIMGVARELLTKLRSARRVPARLLGVALSSLGLDPRADQLALFAVDADPLAETDRDRTLARTVDRVREKFGAKGILPASLNLLGLFATAVLALPFPQRISAQDAAVARWEQQARNVTIIRDDWGIPHIYGRTDADAVFGLMYAQAEDDFNRIEMNYLNAMGRAAETEGESAVYRDLRMKLFIHPDSMRAKYSASPQWLKTLMDAFADGLNFYLHKNPQVTPKVIKRFEPWMALTFSEGSIGGDIERVSLPRLRQFYAGGSPPPVAPAAPTGDDATRNADDEPRGSNGFAIAPSNTRNGHALLLINPHTSFFFRAEVQVVSEEGLNAYGAVTWGQFFVYQGFNQHAGWMHTSSGVDNIDEYLETVVQRGDRFYYRYGNAERSLAASRIAVPFKTDTGMARKDFTVFYSHHGPIVRTVDGKWVSVRLMQEPVKALTQSYSRTRAKDYKTFAETMELHTNSSNNTIFADGSGNIAYFHANFVPKRDVGFDWTRPVDGSNSATEWKGVHSIKESPFLLNPANGWLYNTNNWPYSAAGPNSPKKSAFPAYMEVGSENSRGIHAIRVLQNKKDFTLESLIDAAYDSYLTAFDDLLPPLIRDYDTAPAGPLKTTLAQQVKLLREWDRRWSATSVPTSLAVFWGDEIQQRVAANATRERVSAYDYAATRATANDRLQALAAISDKLASDFGSWRTPWGDINRFQRLTGDIAQPFNDAAPSIPVPFTSARWGSLASFGARAYEGTRKWYGTSGNSFVAVVEFGDSVRAKAVTAGGESGDPRSPHFNDQAARYAGGALRDVYFYRSQLNGHIERQYRPGTEGLTAADSALVGRILLAEDHRDSTDVALAEGGRHADARVRTLTRRALGRLRDPRYVARDSLPALQAPRTWTEPAWRLRYRTLTAQRDDCNTLRAALADSAWAVRLRAADLAPASCAADEALVITLRRWIDALPADAAARTPAGVAWHAGAHALVALARVRPAEARAHVNLQATHRQWQVRMYAARAAALLSDTVRLRVLARDADDNVKEAAIDALAKLTGHADDDVYLAALGADGAQAVRAAAIALKGSPRADVRAAANVAFERWVTRGNASERDARVALLEAAGRPASDDRPPNVRVDLPAQAVALALGQDVRLRVTMAPSAGGGSFVVRLRGDVAPMMAARILALVRAGYYNGGNWHRVEHDFVIQGAGPGTNEYVGYSKYLRDELGTVPHTRGTVGMSTRAHDTGDAQWFVNLKDNLRLARDYTVFAEVIEGIGVVDDVMEGDVIASIEEIR